MTKEEGEQAKLEGHTVIEDNGKGYRVVVASPIPVELIEAESIKALVDQDFIVVSNGGGGIPVIRENGVLKGINAVIDKDFGGELLAQIVGADKFVICTDVEFACTDYLSPEKK